jgi:hypothetical protein
MRAIGYAVGAQRRTRRMHAALRRTAFTNLDMAVTRHLQALIAVAVTVVAVSTVAQAQKPPASQPSAATSGIAEQRIALVIGNSAYKDSPLGNPVNDARAIAGALQKSGFKVIERENLGLKDMQVALREFGDALKKGGGVGLFYYAGHGMQVKGRNFLIPVDAQIEREDEVAYNSVDAGQVLDKMEAAGNRLNIVILDACRNNPFPRAFRSGSAGLAQMDAPIGTLIAFATAPGAVASDGPGKNGLYTQYLLQAMQQPGVKIEDVFKNVRAGVRRDSQGKQIPWESTSLEGDFVFVPKPPIAITANPVGAAPQKLDSIAAPQLQVGDTWSMQTIDLLSGSVTDQFKQTVTAATTDEWIFGSYITDKSLGMLRRTKDGKVVAKWTPKRANYDFPLYVGKTWSAVGVFESDEFVSEHTFTFKVIRQERVVVPAGLFDTLRVEGTSKYKSTKKKDGSSGEGITVHRYWFSPSVGRTVAYEYEETNWKGVVHRKSRDELVSFQRADQRASK